MAQRGIGPIQQRVLKGDRSVPSQASETATARRANRAYASCENCPSCHCAAGRRYCSKPQISSIFRVSRLHKRGVSRSSRTLEAGCGGRFGCALTNAAEADGEIVWSWRPDAGAKVAERSANDGGKRARSPGRSRISRKTIAQGRPDDPPVPVVLPRAFCCTRTMGAVGTRPSLRPLASRGCFAQRLGRYSRRGNAESYAPSLRGAKRRSNPFFLYAVRWIASLRSQ